MKELERTECYDLVVSLYKKCRSIVMEETKEIHQKQRWLIVGRVFALLFQSHFRMALVEAERILDENEND